VSDGVHPWDENAAWWQAEFTDGADPEYAEQILPIAAQLLAGVNRVVEIGAGEGHVSRHLVASGVGTAVAVEPAGAQVREAAKRAGGVIVVQGTAGAIPAADGSFDAVVVCLVLEHVVDLDDALDELARVLEPGGRLVLMLNHPLIQAPGAAWIHDHTVEPAERFWRLTGYLAEQVLDDEVEAGVTIRFHHRPLSRYVNGLADRGIALEQMIEPPPPEGFLAGADAYREAADIPRLLVLVGRRDASGQ
jgi:SAM-dependent methyltransferase